MWFIQEYFSQQIRCLNVVDCFIITSWAIASVTNRNLEHHEVSTIKNVSFPNDPRLLVCFPPQTREVQQPDDNNFARPRVAKRIMEKFVANVLRIVHRYWIGSRDFFEPAGHPIHGRRPSRSVFSAFSERRPVHRSPRWINVSDPPFDRRAPFAV